MQRDDWFCDIMRAHLWSIQSHSEAPAVCQVGADGLRAAEGVGVVIYGDGLVMLRQLQYLQHAQRGDGGCTCNNVDRQTRYKYAAS